MTLDKIKLNEQIRETVRAGYAAIAVEQNSCGCGSGC
jgi:hypothetical protein